MLMLLVAWIAFGAGMVFGLLLGDEFQRAPLGMDDVLDVPTHVREEDALWRGLERLQLRADERARLDPATRDRMWREVERKALTREIVQ